MRALLRMAEQVGERARCELDASEVTVNHYDVAAQQWITLANIGNLGLGEERFPTGEVYSRSRFPTVTDLLEGGEGYVGVLYVGDCLPEIARALALYGKSSCVGVPLNGEDGKLWGELYVTRDYGRPAFGQRELDQAMSLAVEVGSELAALHAAENLAD